MPLLVRSTALILLGLSTGTALYRMTQRLDEDRRRRKGRLLGWSTIKAGAQTTTRRFAAKLRVGVRLLPDFGVGTEETGSTTPSTTTTWTSTATKTTTKNSFLVTNKSYPSTNLKQNNKPISFPLSNHDSSPFPHPSQTLSHCTHANTETLTTLDTKRNLTHTTIKAITIIDALCNTPNDMSSLAVPRSEPATLQPITKTGESIILLFSRRIFFSLCITLRVF